MKLPYIQIEQPIGTFYLTSIPAKVLVDIVNVRHRSEDDLEGIQREQSKKRVAEISEFCKDNDAVFPTPIVVSVNLNVPYTVRPIDKIIELPDNQELGQVIDGQHRLWGLRRSGVLDDFDLPVVLMFDLTPEENAYIFTIINSTQTKVNKSLIYDLFELSTSRSPQRTCHEIARSLNSDKESPFYNRMKMLGKKEIGQRYAILSQGTFVKQMLLLISRNPDDDARVIKAGRQLIEDFRLPLRKYFIMEQDDVIYKVLLNTFNALREVFKEEWLNPESNIVWKTTGFCGVMSTLNYLMRKGISEKTLTEEYFTKVFTIFKKYINRRGISLTSDFFPGGGLQNQRKFANYIVASIDEMDSENILSNKNIDTDYKDFIGSIFDDLDDEEKFELAEAVCGSSSLNSFDVHNDVDKDRLIITYPFADITLELPKSKMKECLKWMEDTFFDGMDYDTWYYMRKSLEKDD